MARSNSSRRRTAKRVANREKLAADIAQQSQRAEQTDAYLALITEEGIVCRSYQDKRMVENNGGVAKNASVKSHSKHAQSGASEALKAERIAKPGFCGTIGIMDYSESGMVSPSTKRINKQGFAV